ncbi:hypothetical protein AX769_09990 [Frondihabitans sp. PAMC 28766]|uniref:hypothetical protein n=1 Tax=Frondihabitans sp. PAMC 28766 TaxID=1795630 RepID=UPI00078BB912|nr:hypothetical protein [Frondihabitans sp. PAMC 28766]AMM20420.1 hypothetical protein AX769_09990 [Frondihabitans sp. PAMC 28766]
MQLGTRWSVGSETPDRLPATVVEAVRRVEQELVDQKVDASSWRWTLTWLERKPVVELDDGTVIRYDPSTDTAHVHEPVEGEPDDDDY